MSRHSGPGEDSLETVLKRTASAAGRMMPQSNEQGLIREAKYVIMHGWQNRADVITCSILRWKDYPGLLG